MWIGGDFNGHCGSDNSGKEDTIGKYGVGSSNAEGDTFVAFAMSHDLRVTNTFFQKPVRHRIALQEWTKRFKFISSCCVGQVRRPASKTVN